MEFWDSFLPVPVSKVSGLETLNIAKKWFIKVCIIQRFLFVVFVGKKQPKHVRKMPEIWKKFKSEVMMTFFLFQQNTQILKSRVSEFLMKSRSRLEILTRFQSRRLRSRLHHCHTKLCFNINLAMCGLPSNMKSSSHKTRQTSLLFLKLSQYKI